MIVIDKKAFYSTLGKIMNNLDEKFLKKITILYVEDDEHARVEIQEIFENFFKEVLVASDGEKALQIYRNSIENNRYIDVIVSDINMPNKNGMELLEDIREISNDLPFIFTTAYSDSPVLLDAIKYKVTSYVLKPIDIPKLILEIQEYSKKMFDERKFKYERDELNRYLSSIDKVAIVLKSDKEGNLIYANNAFYEISKYTEEDIIGEQYNIFSHPDVSKDILNQMWDEAKQGRYWKGKLKAKAKDNSTFYVNTTTIPIFDEENNEIIEYYHVSFSITKEELEKRDFKKKVINNVQDTRRKDNVARKIIDDLKAQLNKYKHLDLVYENLKKEKQKSKKYLNQLKLYASKIRDEEK